MPDTKEIIRTTLELISIDSRNRPGAEARMTDYISKFLDRLKIAHSVLDHKGERQSIIALLKGNKSSKNIIFNGHLDTIHTEDSLLVKGTKILARLEGERIYGLGSSDMKAGLASMLFALKEFVETGTRPAYDAYFIFTGDEEGGKSGALDLLENDLLKRTRLAVIGEPTDLDLGLGTKGQLWIQLSFFGKAAHGSMPQEGKNAILMAMRFIEEIQKKDFFDKNDLFFTPSTVNVGYFNSPGVFNIVPDKASVGLDLRISTPENTAMVKEKITRILKEQFKESEYGTTVFEDLDPCFISPQDPLAKALKGIIDKRISGRKNISLSYTTDGSVLSTHKKVPVIILGPGIPEVIHSNLEYIPIENIVKCTGIYLDILKNLEKII
jgi:succinyl-diaminopimelate desuccinylase